MHLYPLEVSDPTLQQLLLNIHDFSDVKINLGLSQFLYCKGRYHTQNLKIVHETCIFISIFQLLNFSFVYFFTLILRHHFLDFFVSFCTICLHHAAQTPTFISISSARISNFKFWMHEIR